MKGITMRARQRIAQINGVGLTEGVTPDTRLVISARDPDGKLFKLLDHIRKIGNVGHSFSIDIEGKKFDWDGDGSDHIFDIEQ